MMSMSKTSQLGRKAHVLTTTTNRQGQLLIRHNNFDLASFFVQNNLGNFGRLQCVHKERWHIFIPRNDVDLFTLQFVHNSLNTATAHTNTGTDWINRVIIRNHSDLCAGTRITGNGLDLDDTFVNLWHFHLEQLGHELRRCTDRKICGPRCSRRTSLM